MSFVFLSGAKHLEEGWKTGEIIHSVTKTFPDGETYVRLDVKNLPKNEEQCVYVVQTPYPEQDRKLMELFLSCHALADYGVGDIRCVIPYYAYARQDKRFMDGEAVSSLVVMDVLSALGVKEIITVDAHFMREQMLIERNGVVVRNITAVHELIRAARDEFGEVGIVTPDFGGSKWLETLGVDYLAGFSKVKVCKHCGAEVTKCTCSASKREYEVKVVYEKGSLKGKNVLVLDDMIAGGGTMASAAKMLKDELGCEAVICAATHGLFVGNGYEKVAEYADMIIVTDTIRQKMRKKLRVVSIIPVLEKAIEVGGNDGEDGGRA